MSQLTRKSFLHGTATAAGALAVAPRLFPANRAPAFNRGVKQVAQFWAFTSTRTAWQQKAWTLYKKLHKPDFEIDWVILPYSQMHDKVMIAAQAGTSGPDIADIEVGQFGRFLKGEVIFVDLTTRLQRRGGLGQFFRPSATDPWTWKGRVYGLGNELNTCLMNYRWDLWKKAGVTAPINTWEEFAQEAERYHRDTGKYLIDFPFDDFGYWWQMTLQQGGGIFGPGGNLIFDSPAGAKSLTYHQRALKSGWALRRPPGGTGPAYIGVLSAGTVASQIGAAWNFSGFAQQSLPQTSGQWRLQALPRWASGSSPTATIGGTGVTALKASPLADEVADFIVWAHTTSEAVLYDYDIRQTWPTWRPAFADPRLKKPLAFFDHQSPGQLLEQISPDIPRWYNSPYWPETTDAFVRKCLTPAILSGEPAAAALRDARREASSIITFETV